MSFSADDLQVTLLRSLEGEDALRHEWNQLVLQMDVPQVFFTYEWALAVERSFAPSIQPRIFVSKRDGKTIGIAALASSSEEPHKVFFLAASTGDYCDIVSAPKERSRVVAALLLTLRSIGIEDIVLANLPKHSLTASALAKASCGFHLYSRKAYVCGRIALGDTVEERRSVQNNVSRKQLEKRKLSRMAKVGPVSLVHLRTPEQAEPELKSFANAHISRFLASGRQSPLLKPERLAFLQELLKLTGRSGWLDISQLTLGSRTIAWNFGFRFHGTLFWYMPAFDISAEEFSPGSCLLRLMIEDACYDPQFKEIDLGLGDEDYKGRFANTATTTSIVFLSTRRTRHLKYRSREAIAQAVKAIAPLERSARYVRNLANKSKHAFTARGPWSALAGLCLRIVSAIAARQEVVFFEWNDSGQRADGYQQYHLEPVTWTNLAQSAREYSDDPETIAYFIRAAQRLKESTSGQYSAWTLRSTAGEFRHFCWVSNSGTFNIGEVDYALKSDTGAAMIFDCWTPTRMRGCGNYRAAIARVAAEMSQQGRKAWIFSATQNSASLSALLKSDFELRYSLVRRKFVFRMPIETVPIASTGPH